MAGTFYLPPAGHDPSHFDGSFSGLKRNVAIIVSSLPCVVVALERQRHFGAERKRAVLTADEDVWKTVNLIA
jgi:hypothetical protein